MSCMIAGQVCGVCEPGRYFGNLVITKPVDSCIIKETISRRQIWRAKERGLYYGTGNDYFDD